MDFARRRRATDAPSDHVARIGWLLIKLLFDGVVEYAAFIDRFGISRREFQRDLRELRTLCGDHGFTISRTKGGRVFLNDAGRRSRGPAANVRSSSAVVAAIASALGGPLERELQAAIGTNGEKPPRTFLQPRDPMPAANEHVTGVFAFLKDAAAATARVEFPYTSARGVRSVRRVEPYLTVLRSGRYYLVAYDLGRRDWRYFGLDAVDAPMKRDGTFSPRPVPEHFLAQRAVGWIRGAQPAEVTIRVSALVAAAVGARSWQAGQRIDRLADGGADITLAFDDLGEAVRWSLSFGSEARIVAPAEAVEAARETVGALGRAYRRASGLVAVEKRRTGGAIA